MTCIKRTNGYDKNMILHVVPGLDNPFNGIAVAAKLIANEQAAEMVDAREFGKIKDLGKYEEVWVHSCWLPMTVKACRRVVKAKRPLVRMTHANLDPVRLRYHGWKKWLVGPIERYWLRKADRIVATCDAEKAWIEAYLGTKCPEIVVEDVRRFFKLGVRSQGIRPSRVLATHRDASNPSDREAELGVRGLRENSKLHVLYLGRRHPLKGVKFLERAVKELGVRSQELGVRSQELGVSEKDLTKSKLEASNTKPENRNIELKIVSNAFGDELEKVWDWCDVLVLPTLSENFGLVVAEALERGKRVITTDGAPAWGDGNDYDGRLVYLEGYRDGSEAERIKLLKDALMMMV